MYNDNILLQSASAKCPDLLPETENNSIALSTLRFNKKLETEKQRPWNRRSPVFNSWTCKKASLSLRTPFFLKTRDRLNFFFLAEWWQIFLIFITAGNKNLEDAETREAKNAESTLTFIKLITADERFWCNHLHLRNLCTYAYSYIAHVVFT